MSRPTAAAKKTTTAAVAATAPILETKKASSSAAAAPAEKKKTSAPTEKKTAAAAASSSAPAEKKAEKKTTAAATTTAAAPAVPEKKKAEKKAAPAAAVVEEPITGKKRRAASSASVVVDKEKAGEEKKRRRCEELAALADLTPAGRLVALVESTVTNQADASTLLKESTAEARNMKKLTDDLRRSLAKSNDPKSQSIAQALLECTASNLQGHLSMSEQARGAKKTHEGLHKTAAAIRKAEAIFLEKQAKKKRRNKDTGLNKPVPVSAVLTEFLGLPAGTLVSRTSMSHGVNAYIKQHNLKDTEAMRCFVPDAKLKKLYLPSQQPPYGYFNLQKQLAHHFPPNAKKVAAAAAAAAADAAAAAASKA